MMTLCAEGRNSWVDNVSNLCARYVDMHVLFPCIICVVDSDTCHRQEDCKIK